MASLNDSESLKYSPNAFKMANVCILVWNYLYHMKKVFLKLIIQRFMPVFMPIIHRKYDDNNRK